jgi:UDP-GlcNAc:undecaprenyl-phosphate GlcNAc-1-phosphate transferase
MIYSFAFVFALAAAILSLPRIIVIAERLQIYDRPDERKVHSDLTPRIGGIAVALSVIISLMFMQQLETSLAGYIIGAIIVFGFGFYDDIWGLSWRIKFVGQFAAAIIALVFLQVNLNGVQFFGFEIPLPPWLVFTGMVFFIVGGMNSLNLLDGLDGLASGVSLLIFIGYGYNAILNDNIAIVLISLAFAGSILGFLRYNAYPAKIFLGDSGSLLLGFTLSTVPLLQNNPGGSLHMTLPIILLSVPIIDTVRVSVMRLVRRGNPFLPDKTHLHHRLLSVQVRHDLAVLTMHGLTAVFVILSFFIDFLPQTVLFILYILAIMLTLFLPNVIKGLRSIGWVQQKYYDLTENYSILGLRQIIGYFGNQTLLRHSIILFLFTQFLLIDYQSVQFYPIAFILLAMLVYFFFNTGSWSDQFLVITVLISVIYFQSMTSLRFNFGDPTYYAIVDILNKASILLTGFILSCVLISEEKIDHKQILQPIDYLVFIILFLIFIMPYDTVSLTLDRYNIAKAAVIYLGIKSLFSFSVQGNRRVIFSIFMLLLATGTVGVLF